MCDSLLKIKIIGLVNITATCTPFSTVTSLTAMDFVPKVSNKTIKMKNFLFFFVQMPVIKIRFKIYFFKTSVLMLSFCSPFSNLRCRCLFFLLLESLLLLQNLFLPLTVGSLHFYILNNCSSSPSPTVYSAVLWKLATPIRLKVALPLTRMNGANVLSSGCIKKLTKIISSHWNFCRCILTYFFIIQVTSFHAK